MRVRVYSGDNDYNEFFSWKEAINHYGMTKTRLCKKYKVERVYPAGHWMDVDLDYLKGVAVARYGSKKCLIMD